MNNYTETETNSSNTIGYIEKDSSRARLETFLEVSWSLRKDYLKPVQVSIKAEEEKNNLINKGLSRDFNFIKKIILCLILICHSSYRNTQEFIRIIYDYKVSLDFISNIMNKAGERAKGFNKSVQLDYIKDGTLDEIFSNNVPALVGVDLKSNYTFLLSEEGGRKGIDWAVALLEIQEDQCLNLEFTVMDQARGISNGVKEVYPKCQIGGDLFHSSREVEWVVKRLENKAYKVIEDFDKIEDKYLIALCSGDGRKYGKKYKSSKKAMKDAIDLYDEFTILTEWLNESLNIYCESYERRVWIYNYILDEMREREIHSEKIKSLVKHLINNRERLLCFARILEERLTKFKKESSYDLTCEDINTLYRQLTLNEDSYRYCM